MRFIFISTYLIYCFEYIPLHRNSTIPDCYLSLNCSTYLRFPFEPELFDPEFFEPELLDPPELLEPELRELPLLPLDRDGLYDGELPDDDRGLS